MSDDSELIKSVGAALFGERYKADLATALGVSRDTVDDWGKGRMRPRPGVWTDLAKLIDQRAKLLAKLAPKIAAAGAAALDRQ
jgi:DNA-binding XRE family transcriptional regulator